MWNVCTHAGCPGCLFVCLLLRCPQIWQQAIKVRIMKGLQAGVIILWGAKIGRQDKPKERPSVLYLSSSYLQ